MDEISTAMAPLVARIDALSLRERLLVLITVLVLIAALWHARRIDGARRPHYGG
jgi:hypothetical protein